ncbi:MAG: GyrI-like domain-containing protein [Propionibacteriaceae bacterium]|jgi:hypothetical protein|nr:GyrI-like domain-containing protein [Propionibacteriaceae bacterium]
MPVDFKAQDKQLYAPSAKPLIVDVPEMTFVMVDGRGNPGTSAEYANAIAVLYGFSYAVKMSKKGAETPAGYYDFVVPPLEGLWAIDGEAQAPTAIDKERFVWTSLLRVPDFVTEGVFEQFRDVLAAKKRDLDVSVIRRETFAEGLCGQITHIGSYDDEPPTIAALEQFIADSGYRTQIAGLRQHHEIYLGDPRKVVPDKLKTLIRHPVVRA